MDWPKSAGKSVDTYIENETNRLDRAIFEHEIKEYIGLTLASKLRPAHVQVLFEISDDYLRRYTAVFGMKNKNKFRKDRKARAKLMGSVRKRLAAFQKDLNAPNLSADMSVTALLVRSIAEKVSKLQGDLEEEFETVDLHQRISQRMLQKLSLKYLRTSYVAELNSYVEDVVLRTSPKKQKGANAEKLIAGVMSAAMVFSAAEKAEGLDQCVHMARWRAKKFIKEEYYDNGEFPVFRSRPKRKTTV